jgi:hypothetical protein
VAILKLQKGTTTPVVLTITGIVRDVPANNPRYGPQHKLIGHTPTDPDACIFLAPDTAVRQLARVGLTLDNAVGHTVAITRPGDYIDFASPNGAAPVPVPPAPAPAPAPAGSAKQAFSAGAPIAGLDMPETAGRVTTQHATVDFSGPEAKVEQWKRLCGLHKRCLAFVLETEVPLLNGPDVGASPESVSALTAQLFIAATQAGLHR